MRLFDTMVKSVMEYGAEIWGWKAKEELEKVQRNYMKWVLKLDRNTPEHTLHLETKRYSLETRTRKRAMRYEKKLCEAEEGTLWRECWRLLEKETEEGNRKNGRKSVREEELNKRGLSLVEYNKKLKEGEQVWAEIERVDKDTQVQKWESNIRDSRQARDIKELIKPLGEWLDYLKKEGSKGKKGLAITARFRLGSETRGYRYWMREEERLCRLCGEEKETFEHIFERCSITGNDATSWKDTLNGERKNLGKLSRILWKREEKDKTRQG